MGQERDLRIDTLRGLALCQMVVAHMHIDISDPVRYAMGFASAAEGFVFLSGLVAGMIYWKVARARERAIWSKSLRRAALLYASYLGVVLYITAYTHGVRALGIRFMPWNSEMLIADPLRALLLAVPAIFQPGFSDILPMYVVFLLLTPWVIYGLRRGWAPLVLGASGALWGAAQLGLGEAVFVPLERRFGTPPRAFDLFAWQLLYVVGLWVGARRADGRPVRAPRGAWVPWLVGPPVLAVCLIAEGVFGQEGLRATVAALSGKLTLMPLRVLDFVGWVLLLAWLGQRRPRWLVQPWLAFLGQHSLQVFVFTVAAAYAGQLARGKEQAVQLLAAALVVASLHLPALLHQRYRERRARVRSTSSQLASAP